MVCMSILHNIPLMVTVLLEYNDHWCNVLHFYDAAYNYIVRIVSVVTNFAIQISNYRKCVRMYVCTLLNGN